MDSEISSQFDLRSSIAHTKAKELPHKVQVFRFLNQKIILRPNITIINFICLLLFSGYVGFVSVPINMLQLPILRIIYHQDRVERDTTTTISQIFEILVSILIAPIYGILCDKHGRKPFLLYGMFLTCLATSVISYLPSVFPYFIIARLLFVNGFTGMVIPPLLADYIDPRTQGSVAGYMNILGNLGALLSISLAKNRELNGNIGHNLIQFGLQSFIVGLLILYGLRESVKRSHESDQKPEDIIRTPITLSCPSLEGLAHEEEVTSDNESSEEAHLLGELPPVEEEAVGGIIGLCRTIKKINNMKLVVGYMLGFLGTCQSCLLGFSLINYSTASTGNDNAVLQGYTLANVCITIGMLTSALYGIFADKLSKFGMSLMTVSFSTVAVILMIVTFNPYSTPAYISMVFFGLASSGFSILNTQLISQHADKNYRGAINATNSIVCTVGAGMINIIGLYMSSMSSLIPFYMHMFFVLFGLTLIYVLYRTKPEVLKRL